MNAQTQQDNREVTLKFTVNEVNTVLASLQELPHRVSDPIIRSLVEQVQPQIQQENDLEEVQLPKSKSE